MLHFAPELISTTPLGIQLPDAATVRGRDLAWTSAAGLVVATRCAFPDRANQTVVHQYDAAGACTSAHTLEEPIVSLAAGGQRLAFMASHKRVVVLDLATGTKLDERDDSFSAVLSTSGETYAFSGYGYGGGLEVRSVGAPERRYPPPVPRDSLALWVDDARNLLFSNFDRVSRYVYAADESTIVCSRRLGRGEGNWVVSPDGETAAYVGRRQAFLYALRDGREMGAHKIPSDRSAWCLGSNGTLVVATWKKKIYVMRGEERREVLEGVRAHTLAIAPDGQRVAWASETDEPGFGCISLA